MSRKPLDEVLISVVLPVYNETNVLVELFHRVSASLRAAGVSQEVILVDDGSTDGSSEVLDLLADRYPQICVVHLSRNFGHQAAVQAGLAQASGDAVILMDADMQDSPEAIGRFVAHWQEGYDIVYAIRTDRPERLWKRMLFAGFHRLLAAIASTSIPANAGNFSLIDARALREIVSLRESDRYLPGLRSWVGFQQKGIEVRRNPRYDAQPRVSLRGLWRLAKTAVFSFSSFPLTLFYLIGYSALLVFLGLGAYSVGCKLFTDRAIPGWTSHVLVASFFGAINALGICVLGEYVTRIYDQVRARPLYLVDRTVRRAGQPTDESDEPRRAPARLAADLVVCESWSYVSTELTSDDGLLEQTQQLMDLAADAARTSQPETPAGIS
jgi:glycosyltransferase involved in cell wall biosynthesis